MQIFLSRIRVFNNFKYICRLHRNMPWSVLGSVVMVTCCYLLVNVAYLAVLTPQELKESPATAVVSYI